MDTDYQELVKLGVAANRAERLIQSELPWWRKKRRRVGRQWPHLEVGGDCLRIGKTTTKQVLAEQIGKRGWPLVFSDEDWKDNPYLKRAYAGSAASLLNSQLWFAKKKRSQLTNISDSSFWIQVVNPEMDWAYAMTNFLSGNLSERQWLRYWREYQALGWESVPFPDLLIYLTASVEVLLERFIRTARDFEAADEKYIRVMQLVNQRWLRLAEKKRQVLVIDTNHFDYSNLTGTARAREQLGRQLFTRLAEVGWEY